MNRQEQIIKAAKKDTIVYTERDRAMFLEGAQWADEHPDIDVRTMAAWQSGYKAAIDAHPHWISVEDELPKHKELVFITDGEDTDTGFYDYTDDAWQPFERLLGDVTHWMPLPQKLVLSNSSNIGKDLKGGEK